MPFVSSQQSRREYLRRPFNYPGWLEGGSGRLIPCIVADISQGGAQLHLHDDITLPARFSLWFTRDGKIKRGCRIVWQKANRVGVSFFALPKDPGG
jgi:hypothetical protein